MPELNLNDLNTAPELTLDAPAAPSLTLDPAADEAAEQAAQQEAKKVEPSLLERYRSIKQHCTPPMAKLVEGQCSGCFMSLPSATLLELKNGEHIVECDNCGRIIYIEE